MNQIKIVCPCGTEKSSIHAKCETCEKWTIGRVEEDLNEALAEYQSRQRFERGEGA